MVSTFVMKSEPLPAALTVEKEDEAPTSLPISSYDVFAVGATKPEEMWTRRLTIQSHDHPDYILADPSSPPGTIHIPGIKEGEAMLVTMANVYFVTCHPVDPKEEKT